MPPFDKLRRATVPAPNFHILTRVMQDRRRAKGAGLSATGANFQEADTRTIVRPRRGPHAPGRTARLTRRFGTVVLNRPRGSARDLLPSVRLTLVEVAEHDPPAGGEPLHWRRLTTHDVTSVATINFVAVRSPRPAAAGPPRSRRSRTLPRRFAVAFGHP